MHKPTWRARLQYWFDNHMARGTGSMIRMLTVTTVAAVLVIAGMVTLLGLREEGGFFSAAWDSMANMINAEMPDSEAGGTGYILLTAMGAIVGLLFTSILIGIISNGIEERLTALRKGNSTVLERGHIVILGFYPGEYTLLSELVLAAGSKKACLVVAGDMERDEMEAHILDNISLPPNVRIICRKIDICDPQALRVCSLSTCKSVVIAPGDDSRTIKALLAVSIAERETRNGPSIIAAVAKKEAVLPASIMEEKRVILLQTQDLIARIIAHACTQPGLSAAFTDVFNFDGSELYLRSLPEAAGSTFEELTRRIDGAVPLGICRDGEITVNPPPDECVKAEDTLLLFAESENAGYLTAGEETVCAAVPNPALEVSAAQGKVVVIGYHSDVKMLLRELPENVHDVTIASENATADLVEAGEKYGRRVSLFTESILSLTQLEELTEEADYVVLLSDREREAEQADIKSIQLLLWLRDIKKRRNAHYTITVEMRRESNRKLVATGEPADFIVASDMSSMVLAQLTENPNLYGVFRELLSNEGNELYLKPARMFVAPDGEYTVAELRMAALSQGYILFGYLKDGGADREIHLNPPLQNRIPLHREDSLIVIGRQ